MTRSRSRRPVHPARRPRKHRRIAVPLRLLAAVAAVFVAGIGVGAGIGIWLAHEPPRGTGVALKRPQPTLEVPVRAYRPPVRTVEQPSPAPKPPAAATASQDHPSTPESRPAPPAPEKLASVPRETKPAKPEAAPPRHVGRSGTATWLANAVAVPPANGRPMIAIIIDDLGIDQRRTRHAISLPAPLTLAFLPYGHNLPELAHAGHVAGHELMVHVNMEPIDRGVDPGPHALLTTLSLAEVRHRMEWALSRFGGYVGINNHMGSRFTEWPEGMETVLHMLRARGLLFVDSLTSNHSVGAPLARAYGMPYASRDVFLDNSQNAQAIDKQLLETEHIARENGHAIAIGHPHDATLEQLREWIPKAKAAGFEFVPVSAIIRRRMGEG